ncbi:hypothetical protein [Mycobacterium simiae]|uniref:hypothetical protein n=1 Tax=Mycobacterium simiae TaxID=1784 RepID=UPI00262F1451|nr:hypothetical protein [Mycobacterium simiae]
MTLWNDHAGTCVLIQTVATSASITHLVSRAAERQGFRVITPATEIAPGEPLLSAVELAIQRADVVIAILDQTADPNFWFELGLAAAKSRALLIAVAQDDVVLPPSAARLRTIGPPLNDKSLSRLLRQTIQRSSAQPEPRKSQTGVALGSNAESLERSLNTLAHEQIGMSERAFESWFRELLQLAAVPFEQSSRMKMEALPGTYGPNVDFAVSAEELSPNLGDPLPVELIVGQASKVVPRRKKTLESYLRLTGANAVLVVSVAQQPPKIWSVAAGEIFACSAFTLLREMRFVTFGSAVLALRRSATRRALAP